MSTINFSGYNWLVKDSGNTPTGSSNNLYSSRCVVYNSGGLKLQIEQTNNNVYCAEIESQLAFGYGTYYFYLNSRIDYLAPNLVFGLSIYKDDNNEIDIEFSKWNNENTHNTQYVLQPISKSNHLHKFITKLNGDFSIHILQWLPKEINYKSLHGHYNKQPKNGFIIQSWQYKGADITKPTPDHKLHINLWRYKNNPIQKLSTTSINYATISGFKYVKM